jgi:hypothetical protein
MIPLRLSALAYGLMELSARVREEKPNWSPRIKEYFLNIVPPITVPAPWCAVLQQFVTDRSARAHTVTNPLDAVVLEAYVQSYFEWAKKNNKLIPAKDALPGDLVLFTFGNVRYDHIGMLMTKIGKDKWFKSLEGNTNAAGSREGDEVAAKWRPTTDEVFVRWDNGIMVEPTKEESSELRRYGISVV